MNLQTNAHFDKELYDALCSATEETLRTSKERLQALWRRLCFLPKNVLEYPGRFMYNHISTLRQGDFYLLGINPGGDPKKEDNPLRNEIREWLAWGSGASAFDQFGETWRLGLNTGDANYEVRVTRYKSLHSASLRLASLATTIGAEIIYLIQQ